MHHLRLSRVKTVQGLLHTHYIADVFSFSAHTHMHTHTEDSVFEQRESTLALTLRHNRRFMRTVL